MSGIFQGYTNSDGRVRVRQVSKLPAWASRDRGMVFSYPDRVIPYLLDAGQPRTLHDGIAFDNVTGLLLAAESPFGPTNISMGGLLVDSRGAVMTSIANPQTLHQGVGLQNNGRLCIQDTPLLTVPKSAVIIGDSFAAQDTPRLESTLGYIPSNSHFGWANAYAWNRLWVKGNTTSETAGYQGNGGDTTADVLARIGAATAIAPDYIWVHVGINDVSNDIPASTAITNYEAIVSAITGAGITPILITLPPSGNVNSFSRQQAFDELNAWIRSQAGTAIIGEQSDSYRDPDSAFAQPLPSCTFDGVHTNARGAELAGTAVAVSLREQLPLVDPFDTYTEIWTNQKMLGTGGSVERNITGVAPDGFTITNASASSLGGEASKRVRSIEAGEWAVLGLSRASNDPATGAQTQTTNYTANKNLTAGIAVGTLVSLVMEIFPEPGQKNIIGIRLQLRQVGATRQWIYAPNWTSAADLSGLPAGDFKSMVWATPVLSIPAGTTSLNLFVQVLFEEGEGWVTPKLGRHCIIPFPAYV